jgi:diaminopimelate epimerase
MALLPFVKVEGLGNDFLVVDLRVGKPAHALADEVTRPATVRALCDRNFGVGGDGVLAILPGDKGDARMRVLNADGSEAEMCGNGIRCVAKVLFDRDPSLGRDLLRIDTGAGLLACKIDAENGQAKTVTVDMGAPQLLPKLIPVASDAPRLVRAPLPALDRQFSFTPVSMGNPHAVIFFDDPATKLRELAASYGPGIERDARFPRRTNVEFALVRKPNPDKPEIDLVVWERGCGITLACGTGACATVVAACLEGRVPADREIPVHLPGGTLFITAKSAPAGSDGPNFSSVAMRGPANIVFEAEIDPGSIKLPV